jgi:threonylcarbamoyladenosine tRNA methylthiotransferase MtaB
LSAQVITLGCRLNLAESERLQAMLAGMDDLIVVNSCAVTAQAVRDTRRAIRRVRRERPAARLLVTGCAAEIEREALAGMDEVDGLVANAAKLDPRVWNAPPQPAPALPSAHTRAFVQVQNGCDHACTFCVIPQGRGPSRSRPANDVIAEIIALVTAGVREVVLTGVDLTDWGKDLPAAPRIGALVGAILRDCPRLERLRLSSLDGIEIDAELLELIAGEPRLMPHVHLSLQSGDDLVLKRMKRRHSRRDAIRLVDRLRARREDLAIGADLIAGFPTEDEAMHGSSLSIVAELGVVHGHIFPYSRRPGTPAARMPQVPGETVRRRAAELREAVANERRRWLTSLIGTPQRVLAERDGTGHSENFARVRLPAGTPAGSLLDITPTRTVDVILE